MAARFEVLIEEAEPDIDWDYYSGPEDKGFMPAPPLLYGLKDLEVCGSELLILSSYSPPRLLARGALRDVPGWPPFESPQLVSIDHGVLLALRTSYTGPNASWIVGDVSKGKFDVIPMEDSRLSSASGIALASDRLRASFTNSKTGELLEVDLRAKTLSVLAAGFSQPAGLLRLDDRLWFYEAGRLCSVQLATRAVAEAPFAKQLSPRALTVHRGQLLVLGADGVTLLSVDPNTGAQQELPWIRTLGRTVSTIASDGARLFAIAAGALAIYELVD